MARTRNQLALLLGSLCVWLIGCPSAPKPTHSAAAPAPAVADDDSLLHAPSGIRFPPSCENFQREGLINCYDTVGLNVSAAYNLHDPQRLVAVTVYVYPAKQPDGASIDLERHLGSVADDIGRAHPWVKLTASQVVKLPQPAGKIAGRRIIIETEQVFAHRPQRVLTEAWLFERLGWFIKFRITYALDQADAADPAVERFMQSFHWAT